MRGEYRGIFSIRQKQGKTQRGKTGAPLPPLHELRRLDCPTQNRTRIEQKVRKKPNFCTGQKHREICRCGLQPHFFGQKCGYKPHLRLTISLTSTKKPNFSRFYPRKSAFSASSVFYFLPLRQPARTESAGDFFRAVPHATGCATGDANVGRTVSPTSDVAGPSD